MSKFKAGCLVCGKPVQALEAMKALKCEMCKQSFEAFAACDDGHYICDKCHMQAAFKSITKCAVETKSINPVSIAEDMMRNEFIHMHGPEHHYIVVSALLSAYNNAGGDINLEEYLDKALQRAKNVPGGICGLWGSCGAAIGTGIFISIITGATSLSEKPWSLANAMTAQALSVISKNGGPRCCKRNTWIAVKEAALFVGEHMEIKMEADVPKCSFFHMNPVCRKTECLYWAVKA